MRAARSYRLATAVHRGTAAVRSQAIAAWRSVHPSSTSHGQDGDAAIERLRGAEFPRVLVVYNNFPAHDRGAGDLRMAWILRLLRSLNCHVTLFPVQQAVRGPHYAAELERVGVEVCIGSRSFGEFAAARAGLYDIALLSQPHVAAPVIEEVRRSFPEATLVYDTVDLHFRRMARRAEVFGEREQLDGAYAQELDCIRRSDLTATVTEIEAEVVRSLVPTASTVVLPTIHEPDEAQRQRFEATADLLFIGGFLHEPNIDAVCYFLREIFPLVTAEIETRLWVIGEEPPEEIRAFQSPSVIVTGYVPRVEEYFRRARVFVSPLRYGAGMKGKNGHAMAFGLPLVTTSIGAEGMDLADGEHALIRDGAEAFAAGIIALYSDPMLWERLSTRSQQRVRERWSPDAIRPRLEELVTTAARRSRR